MGGLPDKLVEIQVSTNRDNDLAILRFATLDVAASAHAFQFGHGDVLDEVLVMGFPPIPGFDAIQLAEAATIASKIKASTGSIAGNAKSYLSKQEYLLITARTKGGSSGAPVINKEGFVIAVITDAPADNEGFSDTMGFGLATSLIELRRLQAEPERLTFSTANNLLSTASFQGC